MADPPSLSSSPSVSASTASAVSFRLRPSPLLSGKKNPRPPLSESFPFAAAEEDDEDDDEDQGGEEDREKFQARQQTKERAEREEGQAKREESGNEKDEQHREENKKEEEEQQVEEKAEEHEVEEEEGQQQVEVTESQKEEKKEDPSDSLGGRASVLFVNEEEVQEEIRLLEFQVSSSLGPAAVAVERRRKVQNGYGRENASACGREASDRGSEALLNSAGIVEMLLKHDKFRARPKLVFQNGEYRQEDPTEDELAADLARLMRDSPHVVLERHGACLEAEHLRFFKENFAASPEVQFYVKSLSDKSSLGQSEKTAANRRLAKMRQLVADGDFFSEAAMQARQPALYHEFLGRYTSMPHATHASSPSSSPVSSSSSTSFLRPFRAPGGSASTQLPAASSPQEPQQNEGKDFFSAHPRSLSSCLLSAMDSRMLRRQVQEERDRWRRQDEELLANIDGGRALKTLREEREARRLQRFLQREEHRERREDEEEESEGIDSDLETEEDEESTDNVNGDHPGVAPAGGKRRRRFVDATTYAQKQDDFLLLMQENFLAGRDAHYIDYKSIDQDEALDDLQEVDRDAEEKYFCGEDEPTETDAEKRPPA